MKEMNAKHIFKGEVSMKKMLFVVVLAFALVMAFAAPALAKYAGFSSSMQYVPWATATSMASANADAATQAQGPHKGYATTTIKCAVCHSVHRGENTILTKAVGNGCAYCHSCVSAGGGAVASNLIAWYSTNGGPHSSCSTSYCHGGPHGVGASTYAGLATRLLVSAADSEANYLATANGLTAATTYATWNANSRALGTAAVCGRSGCHTNSMFGVVTSGATKTLTTPAATVTGHRVIAAATTTWNATGQFPMAGYTGTVAYAGVTYCNSCHDLVDDCVAEPAFPHALTDAVSASQSKPSGTRSAVWLTAAAYAGATEYAVSSYNDYSGAATVISAAGAPILDGICLKCHRGGAGASGVGLTF